MVCNGVIGNKTVNLVVKWSIRLNPHEGGGV
jgi:hypothetical protein